MPILISIQWQSWYLYSANLDIYTVPILISIQCQSWYLYSANLDFYPDVRGAWTPVVWGQISKWQGGKCYSKIYYCYRSTHVQSALLKRQRHSNQCILNRPSVAFNSPGVARAVLQTALSLTDLLTHWWLVKISFRRRNAPTVKNCAFSHKID